MTHEGVTGMEQYKWGDQNTNPEQELVLPFTRMVAGPMDFTPGALTNANRESWRWNVGHPMSLGTRCHQLAMYVIYESPLQMLADSPTRYRQETDTMKFLSAVPTVWDDTNAAGRQGLRLRRDRPPQRATTGIVGAMTDWDARELTIKSDDFLPPGDYELEVWSDGVNADRNGQDLHYEMRTVTSTESLARRNGAGWRMGCAISTTSRGQRSFRCRRRIRPIIHRPISMSLSTRGAIQAQVVSHM